MKETPIFGMIKQFIELAIHLLENVQQVTIKPIIRANIASGALIKNDKKCHLRPLEVCDYNNTTVCHGDVEYARDEKMMASAKSTSI